MLFTAVARPQIALPRPSRLLAAALVLALPCLTWHAGPARAATTVSWHPDLPAAQRASQVSGRPVLAIFTASWMPAAAAVDRTALASDEAVAVVTACYEPVCVDVDAHPEATKHAGVSRVPTACVLTPDGRVVATFEVPATTAEFVAAAARAAQDAAVAAATSQTTVATIDRAPAALTRLPGNGSPFGSHGGTGPQSAVATPSRGIVPPGGRAITAVAAKVRMLSDFASNEPPQAVAWDAIADSFRETSLEQPQASSSAGVGGAAPTITATPGTPPMTSTAATAQPNVTPVMTPAEAAPPTDAATPSGSPASAPTESLVGITSTGPLGIEPNSAAPQASPSAAPWLGMPQAAPAIAPATAAQPTPPTAAVAAAPAQAAAIEPRPAAPAAADRAAAEPAASAKQPTASSTSSFLATLQKPFAMFSRPAAPEQRSEPAVAATPTAAVEPDPYGSMPVGLEGYCPVTLAERGVWVEGRAQWGARHRGRTYLFAGEQQLKSFLQHPDRYAPALSGDDPVLAFDSGKCTPGQRRYGVTYQSRMYLFSSSDTRDAFAANPQRYTAGTLVAESRGSAAADGTVVR